MIVTKKKGFITGNRISIKYTFYLVCNCVMAQSKRTALSVNKIKTFHESSDHYHSKGLRQIKRKKMRLSLFLNVGSHPIFRSM